MAHELGSALRASCTFVSHTVLTHRVLPLIEDWLAATRTREVCRRSATSHAGKCTRRGPPRHKRRTTGLRTAQALMRSDAAGAFQLLQLLQTGDGTVRQRLAP
jgi:hypothetical protein